MKLTKPTLIEGAILPKGTILTLEEKKDHLIKKMYQLTPEQQDELIQYFNIHPNFENKLDWNKAKSYTWEEIIKQVGLYQDTKSAKKKKVKMQGVKGLKYGEDYLEVPLPESAKEGFTVNAYIPLNYEASKLIASDRVGGCEGKWCTAYQKTDDYWMDYIEGGTILIYILIQFFDDGGGLSTDKIAIAYNSDTQSIENFNKDDVSIYASDVEEATGISYEDFLHMSTINKAVEKIDIPAEPTSPMQELLQALGGNHPEGKTLEDLSEYIYTTNLSTNQPIIGNDVFISVDEDFFIDSVFMKAVFNELDSMNIDSGIYDLDDDEVFEIFLHLVQNHKGIEKALFNDFLKKNGFDGTINDIDEDDFREDYPDIHRAFIDFYRGSYDMAYESEYYDEVIRNTKEEIEDSLGVVESKDIDSWRVKVYEGVVRDAIEYTIERVSREEQVLDLIEYLEHKGLEDLGISEPSPLGIDDEIVHFMTEFSDELYI